MVTTGVVNPILSDHDPNVTISVVDGLKLGDWEDTALPSDVVTESGPASPDKDFRAEEDVEGTEIVLGSTDA